VVFHLWQIRQSRHAEPLVLVLLIWASISFLWFIAAAGSHSTLPVLAVTMPLILLLGPAAAWALSEMQGAHWRISGPVLGGAGFLAAVAVYVMLDWARLDRTGETAEVLAVIGMFVLVAAGLGYLAANRRTAPSLVVAALVIAVFPVVSSSFGIALSALQEPVPSPVLSRQVDQLRFTAREMSETAGGRIVVHPSLAADATWPLRDIEFASSALPDEDTAFVLWPIDLPAPAGMVPVDGSWALTGIIEPPTSGFLRYLRWFTNRNILGVVHEPVAVYGRATE
jgi:hypothetical protein